MTKLRCPSSLVNQLALKKLCLAVACIHLFACSRRVEEWPLQSELWWLVDRQPLEGLAEDPTLEELCLWVSATIPNGIVTSDERPATARKLLWAIDASSSNPVWVGMGYYYLQRMHCPVAGPSPVMARDLARLEASAESFVRESARIILKAANSESSELQEHALGLAWLAASVGAHDKATEWSEVSSALEECWTPELARALHDGPDFETRLAGHVISGAVSRFDFDVEDWSAFVDRHEKEMLNWSRQSLESSIASPSFLLSLVTRQGLVGEPATSELFEWAEHHAAQGRSLKARILLQVVFSEL